MRVWVSVYACVRVCPCVCVHVRPSVLAHVHMLARTKASKKKRHFNNWQNLNICQNSRKRHCASPERKWCPCLVQASAYSSNLSHTSSLFQIIRYHPQSAATTRAPVQSKMPISKKKKKNPKNWSPKNNPKKILTRRMGHARGRERTLQEIERKKLHLVFWKKRACSDIRLLIGSRGRLVGNFATCPVFVVCRANRVRGPPDIPPTNGSV